MDQTRSNTDRERITMLLENQFYPEDPRVRREAESLVKAGHAVEVIAPRAPGQPRRDKINGVVVRRFPLAHVGDRGAAWPILAEYGIAVVALHAAAARALARGSTVLHIHNPPDILFPAGLLFRMAGRQVVFDHHDLAPELVQVKFGARRLAKLAQICERLTFAVANHVIATNQSHARIALTRGGKRPAQVTVVRNGPPESWTRLPLHIREGQLDPVHLAYVGTISSQDGVAGMAEVLECLRDRSPSVGARLTVIGDGDAREELEATLSARGLSGSVNLIGRVPPEQVPGLLQDADVCVEPAPSTSLNDSSTMIKLSEYLALGKPTVAYDLRETRFTIGEAGMLVPPGDVRAFAEAIAKLARDPAFRHSLSSQARERARELTWERSEPALLTAYASFGRRRRRYPSSGRYYAGSSTG